MMEKKGKSILKTVVAIVGIVVVVMLIMSLLRPKGKPLTPRYTEEEGLEIGSLVVESGSTIS